MWASWKWIHFVPRFSFATRERGNKLDNLWRHFPHHAQICLLDTTPHFVIAVCHLFTRRASKGLTRVCYVNALVDRFSVTIHASRCFFSFIWKEILYSCTVKVERNVYFRVWSLSSSIDLFFYLKLTLRKGSIIWRRMEDNRIKTFTTEKTELAAFHHVWRVFRLERTQAAKRRGIFP